MGGERGLGQSSEYDYHPDGKERRREQLEAKHEVVRSQIAGKKAAEDAARAVERAAFDAQCAVRVVSVVARAPCVARAPPSATRVYSAVTRRVQA